MKTERNRSVTTNNPRVNNLWAQRKISAAQDKLDKILYDRIKVPKTPEKFLDNQKLKDQKQRTFSTTLEKSKQFFKEIGIAAKLVQTNENSNDNSPTLSPEKTKNERLRSETYGYEAVDSYYPSDLASTGFKDRFNSVNEKNEQYFQHLKGDCKCGKCNCSRCKCNIRGLQVDFQRNNKSIYQQEIGNEKGKLPEKPFLIDKEGYLSENKMELISTTRKEFSEKKAKDPYQECVKVNRNSLICGYQNIDPNTTYGNNFINKQIPQNIKFTPIESQIVPFQIPFRNQSETRTQFKGTQETKNFKIINFAYERDKKLRPPIDVPAELMSQTTYRRSHQNWYKPTGKEFAHNYNEFRIKNSSVYDNIPSYETQFQSVSKKEYIPKKVESCMAAHISSTIEDTNKLSRRAYMYRQYHETKGKFS